MSDSNRAALIAKLGATAVGLVMAVVITWEGYNARVYQDPIGRLAVCYGHDDPKLTPGATYSAAECRAILDADLLLHAEVLGCIEAAPLREMTDGQKAALVSFAYNVGVNGACRSTFVRRINAGEGAAACAELSRWIYAGGKVQPGLVNRRAAERRICEAAP